MSTKYVRGEDTPLFPHHAPSSSTAGISGKKIIFLAGGGIVLFLLVVLLVVMFSKKEVVQTPVVPMVTPTRMSPTNTPTLLPTATPSPEPKRITIQGVDVLDFMAAHPETMPNGAYLLERNGDFQIVYDPKTGIFSVTILNPNFVLARARAEDRFPLLLGIEKEDACPLNVEMATPADINKTYAGLSFGLSYCP